MFRVSIAVHKSPSGEITVLAASEDADRALAARNNCKLPGEAGVFINAQPSKLLKNRATAAPTKPVKRRGRPSKKTF